jgi:hypothetical protein
MVLPCWHDAKPDANTNPDTIAVAITIAIIFGRQESEGRTGCIRPSLRVVVV